MKCELCNINKAETAIQLERDGEEQELYVCRECARRERLNRQKNSQRTRKVTGLPPGVTMSVTGISADGEPPPFLGAIVNAFHDMVSDLQKADKEVVAKKEPELFGFPCSRISERYRIGSRLHLEGLNLIGELEAVHRSMRALGMELSGVSADGIKDCGHVFSLRYSGSVERAKRVVADLLREEENARVRLRDEMQRVFSDSICRALAVLKNCRLLSPGELFDILSPLRLASQAGLLEGVTLKNINGMLAEIPLDSSEDSLPPRERDQIHAERADRINAAFEEVVFVDASEGAIS